MPRIYNRNLTTNIPASAIYVGRSTMWGNPYRIGPDGTRAEVIAKFEAWLVQQPNLMARLPQLRGRDLVCHCAPLPCHADVLLRLANGEPRKTKTGVLLHVVGKTTQIA